MAKIKFNGEEFEVDQALVPVLKALHTDAMDKMPKMDMSGMADLPAKMDALKERADGMMGKYDAAMKKMDEYESMMGEIMKMLGEMAQDGMIDESKLEDVSEALRGDSIDMSPEAKAEREKARKARELEAFNARLTLVTAAKALRIDAVDTLDSDALAKKIAEAHLGRELRADEASPAYVKGVCAVVARDAERIAQQQLGAAMNGQRGQQRVDAQDAALTAQQKYEASVRKGATT